MKTVHFSSQILFQLSLAILTLILPAQALKRTVGPADDPRFQNASRICDGSDPKMFQFGTCSVLISCIFNNLDEAFKASLGTGTSIAALLPTILALIGSPPLELVQLALVSPHRALATCCFTIGLPSGLFRQLRPLHTQLSNPNPREPRVREWTIPLPSLSDKEWHNIIAKIAIDALIMTLASIMLWRN
ncbi:uncharacterized protein BDZ99DRAFT_514403 [Mytilinidion resinicola]|uniref:Uncharacterized protein n=1 Tax=Mytilinidion resinicola TaxID=574789 RepID=A0A6A6Z668_9PEZI|nr:uncharacterized protein BDZ99DRAFT_514403 [Mytilinidion resinicola]KAF2815757.1 hypothetical protein BDZ99DRAFT_514403 [Mytilinidion resinicola]